MTLFKSIGCVTIGNSFFEVMVTKDGNDMRVCAHDGDIFLEEPFDDNGVHDEHGSWFTLCGGDTLQEFMVYEPTNEELTMLLDMLAEYSASVIADEIDKGLTA